MGKTKTTANPENKFWEFKNVAGTKKGELNIYESIGFTNSWWGSGDEVTPKKFRDELKALGDISELDVHICSSGGSVHAGTAIYSMLKQHKATKNVYIEGVAASIASVVAMAGDNIYISKLGMMMVHQPALALMGLYNARDMHQFVAELDKIQTPIVDAYKDKSGLSDSEVIRLLDGDDGNGTWLTASEVIAKGLADDYIPDGKEVDALNCIAPGIYEYRNHKVDLTEYPNAPKLEGIKNKNEVNGLEKNPETPPTEGTADPNPVAPAAVALDSTSGSVSGGGPPVSEYERGIQAERARLTALDNMVAAAPECAGIIAQAKADGSDELETSRRVFAHLSGSKSQSGDGAAYLNALKADAGAIPPLGGAISPPPEDYKDSAKKMTEQINKLRGVK